MSFITNFFKEDHQAIVFVIIGIILLIVPDAFIDILPYLIGIVLSIYGCINFFVSKKYPDSDVRMGDAIVNIAVGVIILLQKSRSVSTIGVIWAMQSFNEVAEEIEDYRSNHEFHLLSLVSIIIATVLAVLLMLDPYEHFSEHVRILGLEMIFTTLIHNPEKKFGGHHGQ